jgi:hypothetical protein
MILYLGESKDLLLPIPGSSSDDVVTYEIFSSSGTVLQSGSMTFVRDEIWKVASFTPSAVGVFILKGNNTTISQKRENEYSVRSSSEAPTVVSSTVPTAQEMLDNINKAINAMIVGGAVQSYSINGRNIQNMTLTELRNLRKELQMEINSDSGPARNFAQFGRL